MNRGVRKLGKLGKNSPEDVRFHAFYGAPAIAVLDAWHKLMYHALLPKGGWFFHLLWALMFMKLYGTEPEMCANAGGSCGAIDPKTFRKWVWPFIEALAELQYKVVSIFCLHCTLFLFILLIFSLCLRFYLRTDLKMTTTVTAFLVLMV